jgi:hypothetical protein
MAKLKFNYKKDKTIMDLIDDLEANEVHVRFEKGRFKSSDCIVDGQKLLLVNRLLNRDQMIDYLRNYLESHA